MAKSMCSVGDCDRFVHGRSLCEMHYARWKRHGSTDSLTPRRGLPIAERFFSRVDASGVCWEWTGSLLDGYGVFQTTKRRTRSAHRWSYEHLVGPVPAGLELDHLCRNRRCVDPNHLEPVPQRVNTMRGSGITAVNARKTHCVNGHPFEGDNIMWQRRKDGTISGRSCRTCHRARTRVSVAKWKAKQRSAREVECLSTVSAAYPNPTRGT